VSQAQVVANRKRRAVATQLVVPTAVRVEVIQSAPHGQITVVTSDPADMRLVAGDKNITVVAI
jgi:hypothetical protein